MSLIKAKNILKLVLLTAILYGITLYFFLPYLWPEASAITGGLLIERNETNDRLNILFLFIFIPIFSRYMLNILLSPFFEIATKINSLMKKDYMSDYQPKVAVLIPAWNEEVGIIKTIESVLANTYENKEIVVINDGSTDSTHEVVRDFIGKHTGPTNIKYIRKKNSGKAKALNMGIALSKSDIVITVDADSVMHKEAIEYFVEQFRYPDVMSVAGNVKIGNNNNSLGLIQSAEYLSGFYFKKADSILNSIYIVGGAAAAYRRVVFEKLGSFDSDTITEDIEMSTRIQSHDMKITYAPKAIIYTEGPKHFNDLLKQRLRWKWGRFETFIKYRKLFFNPNHNKILTMFILPLSLLAEILLFFEVYLLAYLYTHIFMSGDYLLLLISIFILSLVFSLQVATDEKGFKKFYLLAFAPVIWLFFYVVDFVEYRAQLKCLVKLIKGDKVQWQKWKRAGVFNA